MAVQTLGGTMAEAIGPLDSAPSSTPNGTTPWDSTPGTAWAVIIPTATMASATTPSAGTAGWAWVDFRLTPSTPTDGTTAGIRVGEWAIIPTATLLMATILMDLAGMHGTA